MGTTVLATRDGGLDKTDIDALAALKIRLGSTQSHVLLHLHGGLVKEAAGRAIAARLGGVAPDGFALNPAYEQVYIVWRTGVFETLGANWKELFEDDRLYQVLLKKLIKLAARKLGVSDALGRGGGQALELSEDEIDDELWIRREREPFTGVDAAIGTSDTAGGRGPQAGVEDEDTLADEFEFDLQNDPDLLERAEDLAAAVSDDPVQGRAPALSVTADAAAGRVSLGHLDPVHQATLEAEAPSTDAARAIFTAANALTFLVKHGAQILVRVVRRYRKRQDHGFYATIVEELARELYGDLVGAKIWGMMKQDAADPFGTDATLAGQALVDALSAKPWKRLTITAHSAGSIWAASLLQAIAALPNRPAQKIDLVLLAPAVRMDLFAETIDKAGDLLGEVRMFTMEDALERKDAVLGHDKGFIYPSSLLYLVSALFEERAAKAFTDAPILGMQRFLKPDPGWIEDAQQQAAVRKVQAFFAQPGHRIVYSKSDGGDGLSTQSDSHGGFDSEHVTVASVAHFLR